MDVFEKANTTADAVFEKLLSLGAAKVDANLVVSSILHNKTCMWMNNDPITDESARQINDFLGSLGFDIYVVVSQVPGRDNFIWETKRKRK